MCRGRNLYIEPLGTFDALGEKKKKGKRILNPRKHSSREEKRTGK
jgi:hypothetical protein